MPPLERRLTTALRPPDEKTDEELASANEMIGEEMLIISRRVVEQVHQAQRLSFLEEVEKPWFIRRSSA